MKPRVKYAGRPFEPAWRVDYGAGIYWTDDWADALSVAVCGELEGSRAARCLIRQRNFVGWSLPAEGGAAA